MNLQFTWPIDPPIDGLQNPEDWPEVQESVVREFNNWFDPDVQAEIARRVAKGHLDDESSWHFIKHMEAAARLEMVRYARQHRGQWVSVNMYGFRGGMKL